ncbi:hypothetical protein TWF106_009764 [Orbilia oligospora]|uniref:DUF4110 domain-containing protein n=2 Tax=Orbilia oligospora TaxID=2813651 RepID=A0A7C8QGU6_ORBOL|nr:hypothetical protein TWF679_002107 [Orbilia oligospora]KAF3212650.1 hypothetical protein TWF106_009764 [Orbilia oligospora]
MAKDKKAKAAEKKARTAAKSSKKAAKKEKKVTNKRRPGDDSDSDDQDIDAILEEYKLKQAQHMAIAETICPPPPVRANSILMPHPTNSKELFLFGGEIYTGTPPVAKFFNDLYVYHTERNEWRSYTSPNSPMPRSGAAMTSNGQGKPELWLFGGEFSSPKQGIFYHYADFWKLDCSSREWTKIEAKGAPSGRSGHRMTHYKNYILLFGGFQATSPITTKYLNDLYIFDTNTHTWTTIPIPASYLAYPPPRSSFSFLPHEHGAVLFGGYSRVKAASSSSAQQAVSHKKKSLGQKIKDLPLYHTDSYLLRINPADPKLSKWEKRKKPGNMPTTRVGITMAHHRGRGVMFGGVYDVEDSEEALESKFFEDMWVYAVAQNRFWEIKMRKSKKVVKKDDGGAAISRRDRAKQDELELLKNLALLETKAGVTTTAEIPLPMEVEKEEEEELKNPLAKAEPSLILPAARFNVALAVQGDWLYMYGGTFEKGDVEITFDEMYKVNLEKLDGVITIFKRDSVIGGEEDMDLDDDDEDEDGEEDSEMDDEESEDEEEKAKADEIKRKQEEGRKAKALRKEAVETPLPPTSPISPTFTDNATEIVEPESNLPLPLPFETLREYFVRTSELFQSEVVEELRFKPVSVAEATTVKEIRTAAFEMAEKRWWDVREEVREEERKLEELGVTESVVMTDKDGGSGGGSGGPRRR